jgi:hypothetical protein
MYSDAASLGKKRHGLDRGRSIPYARGRGRLPIMTTATGDRSMNSYPRVRLGEGFGRSCAWVTVSHNRDFGPKKLSSILLAVVMTVTVAAPTASFAHWLGRDPVLTPLVTWTPPCCCPVPSHAHALTYPWWGPRLSRRHSAPYSRAHSKSELYQSKQRTVDVAANTAARRDQTQLKRQGALKLDEREALYREFLEWLRNQPLQGRH